MAAGAIEGERLTSWAVTPGGERVRLGFTDAGGDDHTILLPVELLSALMMTIPRMLRQALDAKFGDGSLRMIHELGDWRVERAAGTDAFMLSLATPDGFEVTFAIPSPQADRLGTTLHRSAAGTVVHAATMN